jgi:type IV secretion system protein TrbD
MSLEQHSLYRSANRPHQLMGVDREAVIWTAGYAAVIAVGWQNWRGIVVGIVVWSVVISLLRIMARKDPLLRTITFRHLSYRDWYPAKASTIGGRRIPRGHWSDI